MCENGIWCAQNSIFVLNFLIETIFKIETNWTLLVLGSLGKTIKSKGPKVDVAYVLNYRIKSVCEPCWHVLAGM